MYIVKLSTTNGGEQMTVKISKKEFKKLYNQMTMQALADHYGVSRPTVTNWAKKLGLSKRKSTKYVFVD